MRLSRAADGALSSPTVITPPRDLCIVKLGAIGDVVNSLPLVCRLHAGFPETRIHWVIAPLAHALVEEHPAVDEFLVFDVKRWGRWPAFIRELRSRRFDLVIDLQRILKSGLITRLSASPRRLGFDQDRCKEKSWLFTNERLPANPSPGVTVAQYLEFADHLGLPETPPRWDLPFTPWTGEAPSFCLNIGASKPANLWPTERWAELATRLATRVPPSRIAVIGGPQDRARADEVLASSPAGLLDVVGRLSLKETAGLIEASELFIGCDTGPLHIAVAVGTRTVALFGAADPERTGPYRSPDSVVFEPASCSPCRQRECTAERHGCMLNIGVDRVLEAVP